MPNCRGVMAFWPGADLIDLVRPIVETAQQMTRHFAKLEILNDPFQFRGWGFRLGRPTGTSLGLRPLFRSQQFVSPNGEPRGT